uniref:Superoxide dismutase copper/zinc binding domain-containing protein n=1 Tax=Neogobius melanostomus TaxID=47308 RepID=A0A8C6WWU4_9GOBI
MDKTALLVTPKARLGTWFGPGTSNGQIWFSQSVPQGPTTVNVSLTGLNSLAGGYHVHVLPITSGSTHPCSDANILGHFNPLNWKVTDSPGPGIGSLDQYEVGDIGGKFGILTGRNDYQAVFLDTNLPLMGPYSIVRRSVVVHYTNGSRYNVCSVSTNTLFCCCCFYNSGDTCGIFAIVESIVH